ncbi:hypothetical protein PCE1_002468 [Barthelona sp. PCE]
MFYIICEDMHKDFFNVVETEIQRAKPGRCVFYYNENEYGEEEYPNMNEIQIFKHSDLLKTVKTRELLTDTDEWKEFFLSHLPDVTIQEKRSATCAACYNWQYERMLKEHQAKSE